MQTSLTKNLALTVTKTVRILAMQKAARLKERRAQQKLTEKAVQNDPIITNT